MFRASLKSLEEGIFYGRYLTEFHRRRPPSPQCSRFEGSATEFLERESGCQRGNTSLLPPHATRRNWLGAAGKLRSARAIITCDQPRSSSAIPIDKPRTQNPDHGQSAHSRIPSKSVTAPSKAAQPQLGNFSLVAAIKRNRPMTVKNDANSSVQASAPATGWVTTSKPISTPTMPPSKCKKNPPQLRTWNP